MLTNNRYLNATTLLNKLFDEGHALHTIASALEKEIAQAERLKISLVEEEIKSNPESVVLISNDIDSYIFKLQDVLVEIGSGKYTREVLDSQPVTEIRNSILNILAADR